MQRVGVKELKNRTTQIVRDVRERSQRYVITVDGKPAAMLKPYIPAEDEPMTDEEIEAWLADLDDDIAAISEGLPPGASGVDAVAEQRR